MFSNKFRYAKQKSHIINVISYIYCGGRKIIKAILACCIMFLITLYSNYHFQFLLCDVLSPFGTDQFCPYFSRLPCGDRHTCDPMPEKQPWPACLNMSLEFNVKDNSTHWGRDKMAVILQTIFSNAFSWMEICELRVRFHWSLVLRLELVIFQHWFR